MNMYRYKFFDLSEDTDFDLMLTAGLQSSGSGGSGVSPGGTLGSTKFKITVANPSDIRIYKSSCTDKLTIDNEMADALTIEAVDSELPIDANTATLVSLDNRVGFVQTFPMELVEVDVLNLGDYKVTASTNMKGVKAVNKLDREIFFNATSQAQDAFLVDKEEVIISNTATALTYVEPVATELPTPLHGNDVKITSAYYTVTITPDNEDVLVENTGSNSIWYKTSGSDATELVVSGDTAITDINVFSSDKNFPTYIEPVAPELPTPEQYNYIQVVAISSDINVTATSEENLKVVNSTGTTIKLGDSDLADGASATLTDNTTIKTGA